MLMKIKDITPDVKLQNRAAINHELMQEYAELWQSGVKFPPLIVFYDGTKNWLVDGYHRYLGVKQYIEYPTTEARENTLIDVEIIEGTFRDAKLYSCGVNASHGLKRSNVDKRKAVITILSDDEWSQYSNVKIANICKVNEKLIRIIKKEYEVELESDRQIEAAMNNVTSDIRSENSKNQPQKQNVTTFKRSENPQNDEIDEDEYEDDRQFEPVKPRTIQDVPDNSAYEKMMAEREQRLKAEKEAPQVRTYINKYGQPAQMNVSNIGRKAVTKEPDPIDEYEAEYEDDEYLEPVVRKSIMDLAPEGMDYDWEMLQGDLETTLSAYLTTKSALVRKALKRIESIIKEIQKESQNG